MKQEMKQENLKSQKQSFLSSLSTVNCPLSTIHYPLSTEKNYYSLEQTRKIILNWDNWGFWQSKELKELRASMSKADFAKLCQGQFNGTGADSMSWLQRKTLDFMLKLRETVAMHDLDYFLSDGSLRGWKWADTRFFENGRIEISKRWKVYNPYRYFMHVKLRIAKYCLDKAGASAYKSAYERFK